jgi:hypothetical protein
MKCKPAGTARDNSQTSVHLHYGTAFLIHHGNSEKNARVSPSATSFEIVASTCFDMKKNHHHPLIPRTQLSPASTLPQPFPPDGCNLFIIPQNTLPHVFRICRSMKAMPGRGPSMPCKPVRLFPATKPAEAGHIGGHRGPAR